VTLSSSGSSGKDTATLENLSFWLLPERLASDIVLSIYYIEIIKREELILSKFVNINNPLQLALFLGLFLLRLKALCLLDSSRVGDGLAAGVRVFEALVLLKTAHRAVTPATLFLGALE
jgi:hypothetical protein